MVILAPGNSRRFMGLPDKMVIESCVESLVEAQKAELAGADRIELCSSLYVDGLTPPFPLIAQIKRELGIPVKVMIRPRAGNFNYSESELRIMEQQIEYCKQSGVFGVVFGILKNKELDLKKINRLCALAQPMNITIHKAIDFTSDPVKETLRLREFTPVSNILTSGGAISAREGYQTINQMVSAAGKSISIIAAGKITSHNLEDLSKMLTTNEFHGRKIVDLQ